MHGQEDSNYRNIDGSASHFAESLDIIEKQQNRQDYRHRCVVLFDHYQMKISLASCCSVLLSSWMVSVVGAQDNDEQQQQQMILDNRDTCAHRMEHCDPEVDHFDTKISMDYASSVSRLEYANTHVLLEQSWPTRGPWMRGTDQKVVFVRCGCPVPALQPDWIGATIIHVPVSSVMVQMPNSLSKLYLMGQRSKVAAIESTRFLTEGIPEAVTDIRDGIVQSLDRAPNGQPSTLLSISFSGGTFSGNNTGYRLRLVDADCDNGSCVLQETSCIYPALYESTEQDEKLGEALGSFNSVPGWVEGGTTWILTRGDASNEPTTSLSYEIYFDSQLPMSLDVRGDTATCGENPDIEVIIDRNVASNRRPIYHRLHDLPGGFPDVLITEPRSLGPLADDPTVLARQFLDSDPGEETPLGRAELMKLTALIVGAEDTGNSLFELIESRYNRARETAMAARYRPTVMVGKPGTWNEAARNSWMITVGSSYVGQFLRDANVEYRNSDDSIQQQVCGSGCGACPSGTSDTRCSVPINDYLGFFRWADYWISAGIGANCWSGSCNFQITSDSLLDENREVFSQFLSMRCGSVLALDKAHGVSGNTYWDVGRLRPDLILEDLVSLMHPEVVQALEVGSEEEATTFFRMLPPATNLTGVEPCPRTLLPPQPEDARTIYVSATFALEASRDSELEGAPEFAVFDKLYSSVNTAVAEQLGTDAADTEIRMLNINNDDGDGLGGFFPFGVTVRISNCDDHRVCGIETGQRMNDLGPVIVDALEIPWVAEARQVASHPVLVLDHRGDRIPLADLLPQEDPTPPAVVADDAPAPSSDEDEPPAEAEPVVEREPERFESGVDGDGSGGGGGGISTTGLVILIIAVVLVFVISIAMTYRIAFANGAKTASLNTLSESPQVSVHVN